MLVKDFIYSCSIGTKVELVSIHKGEEIVQEISRKKGGIEADITYLDTQYLEVIFISAKSENVIRVYCGEW